MSPDQALRIAYSSGLDLILISPGAQPPVCRIADWGKYKFEQDKREKEAKKKQNTVEVKEVQLTCRIDTHDFDTKVRNAVRFLGDGNKVKVVLRFRGREMSHQQLGRDILDRFKAATAQAGTVDREPVLDGRTITMIISPLREKDKKEMAKQAAAAAAAAASASAGAAQTPENPDKGAEN